MSADAPHASLAALVAPELRRAVPPQAAAMADQLAQRAGGAVAAILFYGSALRDGIADDGLLDFYVLVDRARDWPGSRLAAAANRILPPNVGYAESEVASSVVRAKYAVMTLARFRRGMALRSLDTTLWTRFSQPCACVYARARRDSEEVLAAVCEAVGTAASWAALLGPARGEPLAFWRALYERTYALELRVESAGRHDALVDRAPQRYAALLPAAWRAAGVEFEADGNDLRPAIAPQRRDRALRAWSLRARLARPLNLLRLVKAALTFDRPLDYVVWKVERHSGLRLDVAPWQRRFPLLAAPGLYWRLRRKGLLR